MKTKKSKIHTCKKLKKKKFLDKFIIAKFMILQETYSNCLGYVCSNGLTQYKTGVLFPLRNEDLFYNYQELSASLEIYLS